MQNNEAASAANPGWRFLPLSGYVLRRGTLRECADIDDDVVLVRTPRDPVMWCIALFDERVTLWYAGAQMWTLSPKEAWEFPTRAAATEAAGRLRGITDETRELVEVVQL